MLGRWTPGRLERWDASGKLARVVRLLDVTPPTLSLNELTALPPFDGADPVRGRTTFVELLDHRNSSIVDSAGAVERLPVPRLAKDTASATAWFKALGWFTLALLVIGLIWLKMRTNGTARSGSS